MHFPLRPGRPSLPALTLMVTLIFSALAPAQQRPRDQTPTWLMPEVKGENLSYQTFDSTAAGEKVSYLLYLPPEYAESTTQRFPVVYWLHGIGGSQQGVPRMTEALTAAIHEGKTPPFIMVFVNGMIRSSYVDSADGKTPVETVAIQELIPLIDATYRTIPTREGRMIEGFSMGGAGAAKWGFRHPDLFGSISIIDGALANSDVTNGRFAQTFQTVYGGDMKRFQASNPWELAPAQAPKMKGHTPIRIVTRTVGLGKANTEFHHLLTKLGLEHEFYEIPDAPHSPNPLYEGLGERNWPFYAKAFAADRVEADVTVREPTTGLLYYAKAEYASADNRHVIANPAITGAFFQIIWSEVEKANGACDWSEVDAWIKPWIEADKAVALRVMWSTSGAWRMPYYKTPTPSWVWQEGAKFAYHAGTETEIPLFWDPIYQRYAWRFLEQVAARYGDNPHLIFVDATPGAETNPYRFGTIRRTDPGFEKTFLQTKASDGRRYDEKLWLDTIKTWVDQADRIFTRTPVLVTLNVGGMNGPSRLETIGDYCAAKGFYVGQNGLGGNSYSDSDRGNTPAFLRWSRESKTFFEMVQKSGGRTGTLMAVMEAAERIQCSYLNVYPEDVRQGSPGDPDFDPVAQAALAYGAKFMRQRAAPKASP